MDVRAEYLTEISKRTDHIPGMVRHIFTSYENFDELVVIAGDRFLSITIEPKLEAGEISEIASKAQLNLAGSLS